MTVHLDLTLTEEQANALEVVAKKNGIEIRLLVVLVIADYLGIPPKTPLEALPRPALTARELLKLPLGERNRILAAQAAAVEGDYQNDGNLTGFDAYDEILES